MKISKRDLSLLMAVIGLLLAVLTYVNVFLPYQERITAIQSEIITLTGRRDILNTYKANRATYEEQTAAFTAEENQILGHFPVNILPENEIMFAKNMEGWADMTISSVSFGTGSLIATIDGGTAAAAETAAADTATDTETTEAAETETTTEDAALQAAAAVETDQVMNAYLLPVGLSYQTTYEGFKNGINYVKNQNNRMVVDAISASYDSTTGNLSGTMTVNMFYIDGTGKAYEAPAVGAVSLGKDNIFNTIDAETPAESETQSGTQRNR